MTMESRGPGTNFLFPVRKCHTSSGPLSGHLRDVREVKPITTIGGTQIDGSRWTVNNWDSQDARYKVVGAEPLPSSKG